ncbi:hypothetical protein HBI57_004750 [Parastagonospora nodorum]|nr:hypothetical protein HBI57_004750 [Parastagonospora nodorum]KAH6508265.1 hypothetical protein HBI58_004770 [Parastagonospora nodorum]
MNLHISSIIALGPRLQINNQNAKISSNSSMYPLFRRAALIAAFTLAALHTLTNLLEQIMTDSISSPSDSQIETWRLVLTWSLVLSARRMVFLEEWIESSEEMRCDEIRERMSRAG